MTEQAILADFRSLIKLTVKNNGAAVEAGMTAYRQGSLTDVGRSNFLLHMYDQGRIGEVVGILDVPYIPGNGPTAADSFFEKYGTEGESLMAARETALDELAQNPKATDMKSKKLSQGDAVLIAAIFVGLLIFIVK